jgi:hypothetical protein
MPEIIRSRDVIVFFKGDSYTVAVSQAMVTGGWPGGQGVMWVDPPVGEDIRVVTYSSGLYGGLLVWGSDEQGDDFTALTRNQPHYRFATIFLGGSLISTSTYERYTYDSRTMGGPLVPIVYKVNDFLYFSLRGYWTNEDEVSKALLPYAPAFFTGVCAQVPKASNKFYLGIQTSL